MRACPFVKWTCLQRTEVKRLAQSLGSLAARQREGEVRRTRHVSPVLAASDQPLAKWAGNRGRWRQKEDVRGTWSKTVVSGQTDLCGVLEEADGRHVDEVDSSRDTLTHGERGGVREQEVRLQRTSRPLELRDRTYPLTVSVTPIRPMSWYCGSQETCRHGAVKRSDSQSSGVLSSLAMGRSKSLNSCSTRPLHRL